METQNFSENIDQIPLEKEERFFFSANEFICFAFDSYSVNI